MTKKKPSELDIDPLMQRVLEENYGNWVESTYDGRSAQFRRFDKWCNANGYDVRSIEAGEVKEFLNELNEEGYAPETVGGYLSGLRVLFNELAGPVLEKREDNPIEELLEYRKRSDLLPSGGERKHDEVEYSYLDRDEVMDLADNVPAPRVRNELLIKLLFQTGVRATEASEIDIDDIDRDANTIRVRNLKKRNPGKEDLFRTVTYQPNHAGVGSLMNLWLDGGRREALSKYAAESDRLFISERSPELPMDQIIRIVRKAAENADLQEVVYTDNGGRDRYKVTAHTLRHSHACHAVKSGIDIRTLQKHMGHESIDVTEKYLRIVDDDVRQKFTSQWAGA